MKIAIFCFFLIAIRLAASLPLVADTATALDNALSATDALQSAAAPPADASSSAASTSSASGDAQPPPLNAAQPNSADAGSLAAMGLSADNGASVASADGMTMEKLYAGIDLDNLVKPYGKPDDQQMDMPPVELPPVEEVREGDNRNFLQIFPEIDKQQEVVSNKLINTYSVQNKKITVRSNNTVNYLKTLNVNTNYVTNVQRVNHPKQEIHTLTFIQNRYIPKLIVKHTRTDRLNELPPKEVLVPPVVQESTSQLPPIVEKVDIEREDYDPNARAAAAGAGAAAAGADQQQPPTDQQGENVPSPDSAPPATAAQQSAAQSAAADQQQPAAPPQGGASADQQNLARLKKSLTQ